LQAESTSQRAQPAWEEAKALKLIQVGENPQLTQLMEEIWDTYNSTKMVRFTFNNKVSFQD